MATEDRSGTAAAQAALWGQRASDWADQEERNSPLFRAVFDEVGLSTGTRLLDIGCGAGVACRIAWERGARVVGLDATPELIEIARAQVPAGEFHQGEMEQLRFDTDSFDVVTGFNAFQYAADPVNALREARRVVRPGGHVAIAVLSPPGRSKWFTARREAVRSLLPPPPPDAPNPIAISSFEAISRLARDAGLEPVSQAYVSCPGMFIDKEEAIRLWLASAPNVRAIEIVGEAALRSAIADVLPHFRLRNGTYQLDDEFMYVITTA